MGEREGGRERERETTGGERERETTALQATARLIYIRTYMHTYIHNVHIYTRAHTNTYTHSYHTTFGEVPLADTEEEAEDPPSIPKRAFSTYMKCVT